MCVDCRALETEMDAQEPEAAELEAVRVHPETDVEHLVV